MPEEGIKFSKRDELLSYEEIFKLSLVFKELGISKIRLTGGEPFVRNDIMDLVNRIRPLYQSFFITTNATKLHIYFNELRDLQIDGLNISIDSLDRDKFNRITRRDNFDRVLANIYKSIDLGFKVKLNAVVLKDINEDEILDFVELTRDLPITVRFIEAMPFNGSDGNKDQFISFADILTSIETKYQLTRWETSFPSSSMEYTIEGHLGKAAVIPAYSRSMCGSCNRLRLTAKGEILNCLYSQSGLSLRDMIRNGMELHEIKESIVNHILTKKRSGFDEEDLRSNKEFFEPMTTIGG